MCFLFSLPLMRAFVFYYWRISSFRSAVLAQSTRCLCCPLRAVKQKKKVYCRRLHARTGKESFWHFSLLQLCFFFFLFSLFFFGLLFDESVSSGKKKKKQQQHFFLCFPCVGELRVVLWWRSMRCLFACNNTKQQQQQQTRDKDEVNNNNSKKNDVFCSDSPFVSTSESPLIVQVTVVRCFYLGRCASFLFPATLCPNAHLFFFPFPSPVLFFFFLHAVLTCHTASRNKQAPLKKKKEKKTNTHTHTHTH